MNTTYNNPPTNQYLKKIEIKDELDHQVMMSHYNGKKRTCQIDLQLLQLCY